MDSALRISPLRSVSWRRTSKRKDNAAIARRFDCVAWPIAIARIGQLQSRICDERVYAKVAAILQSEEIDASMAAGTEARLRELGIILPAPPQPGGNYLPAKTVGQNRVSCRRDFDGPEGVITGTVGLDRTIEEGYAAARACALTQLAVLKRHLGSLDAVKSIVTVNGYVNAVPGFPDSPKVINGASDLFIEIFGECGPPRARGDRRFGVAAQRAGRIANDGRDRG